MIIIDASIFIAGIMPDENNLIANEIMLKVGSGQIKAIVPSIFFTEVTNVIVTNIKRKRINLLQGKVCLDFLDSYPLQADNFFCAKTYAELALKYDLSVYDAAYLETAIRNKVKLASLDKKLIKAAYKTKVLYEE